MPVRKDKKRGTWYASFYYTDWTGQRRRKKKEGFATRGAALEFEREFITKQSGKPEMKFSSLVEFYLEDCRSRLRATTFEGKQYMIESKILPVFGDMQLDSITPATVRRWQNQLLGDESGYSQTYLKTIHNQLSAIFNYARRYYNLGSNPAALCGAIGAKRAQSMEFWTLSEFSTFIDSMQDRPMAKAAFETLFWTGIRSGELLALTLNDVDFKKNTISITKTYARLKGEDVISPPKTPKSRRVIPVPEFLLNTLRDYANRLIDYVPSERLFPHHKTLLYREMVRGCRRSGVKKIRVHDIRHSHASFLIELGFSPLLISERLGHENVQTTLETYAHLYPDKQAELVAKLEEQHSRITGKKAPEPEQ